MQSTPKFQAGDRVTTNGTTGRIIEVIARDYDFVYKTQLLNHEGYHTFEEDEINHEKRPNSKLRPNAKIACGRKAGVERPPLGK
ncbi:MAG: hypothetical protein LBG88_04270 [Christensenellaceae bacterium]|jgi:hypothetical protein|nr:hypothetical protein [Christensenellaceae bacterium]